MALPEQVAALVTGLHHVAIVVASIEEARATYEGVLGMTAGEVEHVADQKVRVLVLHAGAQRIELVEPASEGSPISKFLERAGGRAGIHHLAWSVGDVAQAIATLTEAGVEMIDDEPRPGSHGTRIAFVHPRSTGGVLMELVEDPGAHS